MSLVYQVWPKPSCKAQKKGARRGVGGGEGEDETDKREDNIRECTGLECAKIQRTVENRKRWR